MQLSHLRSLANGNTALVVTRSDIQRYINQIGVFRKIHGGGLSFTVYLAVGQGRNGRAALVRLKGAVNINCCLIMRFAVGYGSRRDAVGWCQVHLQQSSAGACAGFHAAVRLDIQRRLYYLLALFVESHSISASGVDNSFLAYVDLGLAVQNCIGSIKINCECANDIRSNVVCIQHTAFRAHITVHCISSNINLLCINLAINIYSGISSNNLPIKMGISCGRRIIIRRRIIILIILLGGFYLNIIQCLRAQLGLACSLYFCALGNGKLGFHFSASNLSEVIKHAIVIIIIVISCKNDIAAAIFSSLEVFCQACINISTFIFDIY